MRDTAPSGSQSDPVTGREPQEIGSRSAPAAPPPSSPLGLVHAAIGGEDLAAIAARAAHALGRPVAIALPALGEPIATPVGSIDAATLTALRAEAEEAASSDVTASSGSLAIIVGDEIHGLAAAPGTTALPAAELPWLQAVAAAAAIAILARRDAQPDPASVLRELSSGGPDLRATLARARSLGLDLARGAVGLCARRAERWPQSELTLDGPGLVSEIRPGHVLALIPAENGAGGALVDRWRALGATAARSAPRTDPTALGEALAEAELLVELGGEDCGDETATQTLRLLIGVLHRDRERLEALQRSTIAPLETYDAEHDTDLRATLDAFLSRHGSTTDTAEAMSLHRHTVGYRLARVQDISGLSPYESEGRERLSLGLKAHAILAAEARRTAP
jgi:PucR C-terminal helix-turn-helix domain